MHWMAGTYLMINTVTDIKEKKIYLWISIVYMISTFLFYAWIMPEEWIRAFAGVLPGALLLGLSKLSKGELGIGDGIVIAILGIMVGIKGILMITMYAVLLCSLACLGLKIIKKVQWKTSIPMIPFLMAGFCFWKCWG